MSYLSDRRRAFKGLAAHCHDKAINALSPEQAARWIALMDALLWCREPEADTSVIFELGEAVK